jgi:hypothetical protein
MSVVTASIERMNESDPIDPWGEYDPASQFIENHVDFLEEVLREEARSAEYRLRTVDNLRLAWEKQRGGAFFTNTRDIESRSLRAEVSAVLRVPERAAEAMIAFARTAVHRLPAGSAALRSGKISERHLRVLADEAAGLDDEKTAELERLALPHAQQLTVGKFERKLRALRESIQPQQMTERHEAAMEGRLMALVPGRDGVGELIIRGDTCDATAAFNYFDAIAASLAVEGETRTRSQLRVDAFYDLVLDQQSQTPPREGETELTEPARPRGIVATVHVTSPVLTLAGVDDTPAAIEGQHPIDPESARRLVGASSGFYRILTDPETGATLSFGRDKYKVPAELRRYLIERDATCRFIGCTRAARSCDIDHLQDWQWDGRTDCDNLAHECRGHHTLKHKGGWKVEQPPGGGGALIFRSPGGRTYRTEPATPPATTFQSRALAQLRQSKADPLPPGSGAVAQTEWLSDTPSDGQPPF